MATQPHHDDDQAKKPNGNQPPPAPKTPKPGNPNMANQPHGNQPAPQTPKPAIPNMSLDEPVEEEATDLGDLLDEEVPLAEAAPRSDVVTELKLGSEDVLGEDVAYADAVEDSSAIKLSGAEPIEEAVEIEEIAEAEAIEEEAPSAEVFDEAEPIEEAAPASAEVFAEDAVEVTGSSAVLAEAAPVSDVDLAKLFGDAPAPAAKAAEPEPDLLSTMEDSPSVADVDAPSFAALAAASPPVSHQPPIAEHIVQPSVAHAEAEEAIEAADEIEEAMPASEVSEAFEEAAEVAEAAPASDIHAAEALVDDAVAAPASHVTPASGIMAAPASEVVAADEHPPEAAPASEIVAADEHPPAAAPASEVVTAADEVAEAAPGSAVFEAGEAVEEAAPASSAVMAAEAAEEIAEAAPASDVLFDEAVAEAGPPSEMKSGELAEEVAEAVEEASSATRKAEAVLDDEVMAAEAVSGSEVVEEAEEAEAFEAGSSAVLAEEAVANGSAVKPASQTASYVAAPSSKSKKGDDDLLVTEEEVAGVAEASAVNLGDMPRSSKGSSVTGIDKVAEALESGVDLDDEDAPENGQLAKTVPSVEFDELLDDYTDSDELEVKPVKGKKAAAKLEDDDTATEAEAVEEEIVTGKKEKKKSKAAAKATGDDIDLDEIFSDTEAVEADEAEAAEAEEAEEAAEAEEGEAVDAEAEAAEAFGAEDAAEAEAAEAFDGDMEATEAVEGEEAEAADADGDAAFFDEDDEKPKKKTKTGKKTRAQDDEEEEEEPSAKKKGKKEKAEKAVPAAAGKGGCFLPLVGGMVLAGLVLIGGVGAGWFFAPDALHDALKESSNYTKPIKPKEAPPPTALQNAHAEMAAGKYKEAVDMLKDETKEQEVGVRGEARWFAYLKALDGKGAPDGDNAEVKLALTEIEKGENKALARQIKTTLDQKDVAANLAKSMAEKNALEKQLASTTDEKTAVEKRIEDARQVLIKGNFIKKDAQFDVAKVDEILKSLGEQRDALAAVNEVLKDGKFKEGEAGVKEVIKIKQGLEANILAVDKVLEKENTKDKGDKGVMEIVDARNKMTKDRDDLLTTIGAAFKELVEGKIVKDSADPRKDLVAGMKLARLKAESPLAIPLAQLSMSLGSVGSGTGNVVEKSFDMAKVFSELGYFRGREPFIQTPEQKLENYVALLQDRNRSHPKEMADINREADWVRSPEAKANADSQAKARYVQGLTLRNLEQFAEAKAAFEETLKLIPPLPKDNWEKLAHRSHKELVEPSAYYLPRMASMQAEGNPKAALTEATLALKAIPDNAQLHAHRGLIRYELVRGMGAKVPAEAQKEIRADAENAAKDAKFAPESAYIVGQLEEELGNLADAEKQYRQAIKMHPAMDDAAGKYRVALARLLLRDRLEAAPAAPPPGDDDKKKKDDKGAFNLPSPAEGRTIVLHPWSLLAVSAIVGQESKPFDEIDDKETVARLTETIKLAEELIASKNDKIKGQGYLLKGSALSKLGKRSEGIKEYSKGLKLAFPGIETSEMKQLIDDHPAFQQPDASGTPSPILAERHFGEGQHYYWSKQYEQAEAQFRQAVKYYDKDARYQYFLGLSLLHQKDKKKRQNADHYFSEGARLEATASSTNPDAVREINASLERIQGQLRQYLNDYRYKAASGEPEAK